MTASFFASFLDSADWPFYSGTPGRWISREVDDVAAFMRVAQKAITPHSLKPTVPSALRGQRILRQLGPEWSPTLRAVADLVYPGREYEFTLRTGDDQRTGVTLAAKADARELRVTLAGDWEYRRQALGRRGMHHTERDVEWSLLGWERQDDDHILTTRTFAGDTAPTAVAYAIVEVLSLVEISPSSSVIVERPFGTHVLERPRSEEIVGDTSHVVAVAPEDLDVDLRGFDLQHTEIRHADLSRRDLSGADFTGSSISNTNLSHAVLDRVSFRRAKLEHVRMSGITASTLDLVQATLNDCDVTEANVEQLVLFNVTVSDSTLNHINAGHLLGSHADIRRSSFDGATLTRADLTNSSISDSSFDEARLKSARFDGSILEDVSFRGADLTAASFRPIDGSLLAEALATREGFEDE